MTVICTGPVSSGTRFLRKIVFKHLATESEHRSMPHWEDFWSWSDDPPGYRYVIITRRPDISVLSALAQGHGDPVLKGDDGVFHFKHRTHKADATELTEWWWRAIRVLASIPDAYWMSYEALVASPVTQVDNLAHWLGVQVESYPVVHDGNEKWLAQLS